VEKKVKADQDELWNYKKSKTFGGVESFRVEQTQVKKDVEKKVKADQDELWNYKSKDLNGLESYRFSQKEADWKKKGRDQVGNRVAKL
jgi:hypothetical protein